MKYFVSIFCLFSLISCGLLSENNKPVDYNSESFKEFKLSKAPDYTNLSSWAVHPSGDLSVFDDFNLDDNLNSAKATFRRHHRRRRRLRHARLIAVGARRSKCCRVIQGFSHALTHRCRAGRHWCLAG